jgi:hypothetical protein
MRQFNVFSELVVPYPGETFEWVVNQAEIGSNTSATVSSNNWPLTQASYTVSPGSPTQATAQSTANITGQFTCSPPAADVTNQVMVISADVPVNVCNDVNVAPGEYFIWQNDMTVSVIVTPDPANINFWPLPEQQHTVPPNGYLTLLIPEDATTEQEYPLVVGLETGVAACPEAGQPKIIVGSPG